MILKYYAIFIDLTPIKKAPHIVGLLAKSLKHYASLVSAFGFSRKRIPKSRNWLPSTGAGA